MQKVSLDGGPPYAFQPSGRGSAPLENEQAFQQINPLFLLAAWKARPDIGNYSSLLNGVASTKGNISWLVENPPHHESPAHIAAITKMSLKATVCCRQPSSKWFCWKAQDMYGSLLTENPKAQRIPSFSSQSAHFYSLLISHFKEMHYIW